MPQGGDPIRSSYLSWKRIKVRSVVAHFIRLVDLPRMGPQFGPAHPGGREDLARGFAQTDQGIDNGCSRVTVAQASVWAARGSQDQKIVILRENYPTLCKPVGDLVAIFSPQKVGFGCSGYVDAELSSIRFSANVLVSMGNTHSSRVDGKRIDLGICAQCQPFLLGIL